MTDGNGPQAGRSRLAGRDLLDAARRVTMSGTLADLHEEWTALEPRTKSRLETVLFRTPIALGIASLLLLVAMMSNLGGTIVHLVARTEYVRYTPLGNDPPQWLLENATITAAMAMDGLGVDDFFPATDDSSAPDASGPTGPDAASRVVQTGFDGFFQPRCGDTIVVSRVGGGPVTIRVDTDRDPIVTDVADKAPSFSREDIGGTFTFTIPSPGEDAGGAGSSLVWPMEGRVDPGRAIGPQTTSDFGLLLEGRVEVVAGRLGSDSTYTVDEHDLELGDQVRLPTAYALDALVAKIDERQRAQGDGTAPADGDPGVETLCRAFDDSRESDGIDKGFIHPDDGKGVNVSLSSNARHADIVRYRTAPIQVRSGWFKRLVNDQVIAYGWATIGVIFYLYRKVARLIVIVADRRRREREGIDTR